MLPFKMRTLHWYKAYNAYLMDLFLYGRRVATSLLKQPLDISNLKSTTSLLHVCVFVDNSLWTCANRVDSR